ncbi:MAG: hypothetical protein P4L42_13755 [Desulfocapsaceae bacterium]|nr:hypothetical protein [Desulfocapsaceae bacterium]
MNKTVQKKASPPADQQTAVISYQPTPQEVNAIESFREIRKKRPPAPRMKKIEAPGNTIIDVDHSNPPVGYALLYNSLATTSKDFADGVLSQLGNICPEGDGMSLDGLNFALAVIDGIRPQDQLETLLVTQMAAVHCATMKMASRLVRAENMFQRDHAELSLNRFTRTFAAQLEALKKYRSTGQQTVKVEHVHVNEGGQAIIGTIDRSKAPGEGE